MESGADMAWLVEKVKRDGGGGDEQETSEASEMARGGARARR